MNYTQIPQRIKDELNHIKKGNYDQWADPLTHPSVFAHEYLKLTPYTYQHLILRKFRTGEKYSFCDEGLPRGNSRTIICKSRQIGISICLAMLAIWAAAVAPARSGPHNNCKVCIVSKTDEAAKKLMAEIKQFVMKSRLRVIRQ